MAAVIWTPHEDPRRGHTLSINLSDQVQGKLFPMFVFKRVNFGHSKCTKNKREVTWARAPSSQYHPSFRLRKLTYSDL